MPKRSDVTVDQGPRVWDPGRYAPAMYGRSAEIYDLLYTGIGLKNFATEAAELNQIIRSECPGARTLLDIGCGTGALLAEMQRWYEVAGVDLSPAMLAVARRRLPEVLLIEADMRTFDLGRTFDAVLCLFSSIGYMTEDGDMERAVGRMAAHVAPGGVLVVDGWLRPDAWVDGHHAEPAIASDENTTVVRLAFSRRDGTITTLDMHHLVRTRDGVEHFSELHRLRLISTADYVAAFEKAGLISHVAPEYMPNRDRVIGIRSGRDT